MRFGSFGVTEILIVLVILLLIFGAKRIPEISHALGSSFRQFKKGISADDNEA